MILPNEIDAIAKLAYQKFLKDNPSNPKWEEIGLAGQTAWRDRVFNADKMRKHGKLDNFLDDCALQAIRKFEADKDNPLVTSTASKPTKKEAK